MRNLASLCCLILAICLLAGCVTNPGNVANLNVPAKSQPVTLSNGTVVDYVPAIVKDEWGTSATCIDRYINGELCAHDVVGASGFWQQFFAGTGAAAALGGGIAAEGALFRPSNVTQNGGGATAGASVSATVSSSSYSKATNKNSITNVNKNTNSNSNVNSNTNSNANSNQLNNSNQSTNSNQNSLSGGGGGDPNKNIKWKPKGEGGDGW